jgi:serine protease Do
MKSTSKKLFLIIPLLIFIGIIIGLGLSINFNSQQVSLAEKNPVPLQSQKELDKISNALAQLAAAVSSSVVSVSTIRITERPQTPMQELYNHPFFRRFFDGAPGPDDRQRQFRSMGLGSGVIVSTNGHILTNNHVIDAAETIEITLQDRRSFRAELIGADPKTDLALIKIDAVDLPALVMNDTYELRVGELVVAVGIPFGLSQTVTMGIVSAVGRSNVGIVDYEDFIQTDAAINPGNSGGAMVNSSGELVGINTAIFSTSGGNMGVGFAIPVKMAKAVMNSLLEHGKVIRGWLGVSIQDITPELAEYFNLDETSGILISDVIEGGPAEKGGLRREDIVIAFNGNPVQDAVTLKNQVAAAEPGNTATITVMRDNEKKEIEVVLEELPAEVAEEAPLDSDSQYFFGAHLQNLTPEVRQHLYIPESVKGVLVTNIENDSPAEAILQQGDVILQVNRQIVGNLQDLQNIKKDITDNQDILLLVYRNGRGVFLTMTP